MNDDVHQLRKPRHEPVFDHMRGRMGIFERHVAVEPEVQIQEGVVRRAPGPDLLAADDAGDRLDDLADVAIADDDINGEDA